MDEKTPGEIIRDLAQGGFARLGKVEPCGTLEVRKLSADTLFYWRVTVGGKTERFAIGSYDSKAPPRSIDPTAKGYSANAAMRAAQKMAQQHKANMDAGGYPGLLRQRQRDKELELQRIKQEQEEVQRREYLAKRYTLGALMALYAGYLQGMNRQSVGDVRSITALHITGAWPQVAALPANTITVDHIADMQRLLLEKGHGRTANKLRSYVRAAYQVALASRSKASIPLAFKGFGVEHNPAADTVPDATFNRADKNPLILEDMRIYWGIIKSLEGIEGAVLRLHLLTGGQRIAQLVRLRTSDIGADRIVLFDGKGKPGQPDRAHGVPLTAPAAQALRDCKPAGTFALSTDGGKTHIAPTTLSNWAEAVARPVLPEFSTKRIRSGVETILAGAGVSEGTRGHLQSHGTSGVQRRHYDGHEYLAEKRNALELLLRILDEPDCSNVVPLHRAA